MKRIILVVLLSAAAGFSAEKAVKKTANAKPAPAAVPVLQVPADAELIAPRTWRHKDAKGVTWIYKQSPFGVARVEESAFNAPAAADAKPDATRVVADGETIRFERPGPFGTYRWERKAADLTSDEKEIVERSRAAAAAATQTVTQD